MSHNKFSKGDANENVLPFQWAKSPKKQSEGVRFFDNSVKNTLPQTVFFRGFCPLG